MSTETGPITDIATGGIRPFESVPIPATASAALAARTQTLHRTVSDLQADTAALRRASLLELLGDRQRTVAARSGVELLRELSGAGTAWRDVARLMAVSVPAVQKWRRGEGITGANRLKLARLVALLDVLGDKMVSEPVSWLEMPVKEGVAASRMDLLVAGRYDLVLELATDEYTSIPVDEVLDQFDPEWRARFVDEHFETFVADDGVVSIRPRA